MLRRKPKLVEALRNRSTQMNDTDRAYAAGLVDGEGTITLSRTSSVYRSPVVSMVNTSIELLRRMQTIFGGGTISVVRKREDHHRQAWLWSAQNRRALLCMEEILPFMHEPSKAVRATYILELYDRVTRRNGKYTPEELEAKKKFEEDFFQL